MAIARSIKHATNVAGVDHVVVAGKARLTGGFPGTTVTAARVPA